MSKFQEILEQLCENNDKLETYIDNIKKEQQKLSNQDKFYNEYTFNIINKRKFTIINRKHNSSDDKMISYINNDTGEIMFNNTNSKYKKNFYIGNINQQNSYEHNLHLLFI